LSVLTYGYAVWSPIVWLVVLLVIGVIMLYVRSRGQKHYKKGTAQTDVFISGVQVPPAEQRHVPAHNIYWGFFEALKGFYSAMMRPHTGIINDYILWLVVVMVVAVLVLVIVV
jgi:uncharacterized membrane protein